MRKSGSASFALRSVSSLKARDNPDSPRAGRCSGLGVACGFVFASTTQDCPAPSASGRGLRPHVATDSLGAVCHAATASPAGS